MAEIWDAYDSSFNIIEDLSLVRGEALPDGVFHLVCEVVVRHTDGSFLLMQRDPVKPLGGKWELTAGGSALKGESPAECAFRELREETGIEADGLTELNRLVHYGHHTLYVDYLCVTGCEKTSVTLQKGETVAYKWVSAEELLKIETGSLASHRTAGLFFDGKL